MISNNCNILRWMEVYPDQMDGTLHIMRYAHDAVYRPFLQGIPQSTEKGGTVIP